MDGSATPRIWLEFIEISVRLGCSFIPILKRISECLQAFTSLSHASRLVGEYKRDEGETEGGGGCLPRESTRY
jgi:hypothetical protein